MICSIGCDVGIYMIIIILVTRRIPVLPSYSERTIFDRDISQKGYRKG